MQLHDGAARGRMRSWLRRWIPQGARDWFNRCFGYAIVYCGVYPDWKQAEAVARGYANADLFRRIESAALAVKHGEAAWEQDGVLRAAVAMDYPLLAGLARVALAKAGRLTVLDFGGALGSTYQQVRAGLPELHAIDWHIVEQPHVVMSGKKSFETESLHFHASMDACLATTRPDVVLLSSVLQYLEHPYALLETISRSKVEYLLIDRHPCSFTQELISVQVVPARLYAASYPSWLFDSDRFYAFLQQHYQCLMQWEGKDPPIRGRGGIGADFRGSLWRKRSAQ